MKQATRPTAEELNAHLECGGLVQVSTHTRATVYSKKHAGWFSEVGSNLYVRQGRGKVCLSFGESLLVSIRKGMPV